MVHFWSLESLELRRQHLGTAARSAKAAILLVLRFTWAIHDDLRLVPELLGQVTSCIDGVLPTHRFETSRFLGASLYWIRGMQPSSFADDACCKLEIQHIELPLGIFRHFEKFPRFFEENWTIGRRDDVRCSFFSAIPSPRIYFQNPSSVVPNPANPFGHWDSVEVLSCLPWCGDDVN